MAGVLAGPRHTLLYGVDLAIGVVFNGALSYIYGIYSLHRGAQGETAASLRGQHLQRWNCTIVNAACKKIT